MLTHPGAVMGSDGAIGATYNVMPLMFSRLRSAFHAGTRVWIRSKCGRYCSGPGSSVCVIVCMLVRVRTNINSYAFAAPGNVVRSHGPVISLTLTHAFMQVFISARSRMLSSYLPWLFAFPLLPYRLPRSNTANVAGEPRHQHHASRLQPRRTGSPRAQRSQGNTNADRRL